MFSVIISFILVVIGALNWLCIGFFQYDFVAGIFGTQANIFSRIVYIIVGIASIWLTYAVIKYKATLNPLAKSVNKDMDKGLGKIHNKSVSLNAEASEELLNNKSDNNNYNLNSHNNNNHKSNNSNNNNNEHKDISDSRNKRYETSKFEDFDKDYISNGYDYKNSRRSRNDFVDDQDDDID